VSPVGVGVELGRWAGRCTGFEGVEDVPVVACSGGADSVALLALTVASGRVPVAVHVDHGLRPGGAAEAAFVARVAGRLGVEARSVRVAVGAGPNLEARARAARYNALDRARAEVRAATVLVGHTADDQAETVLLNLMRGSAAAGLGAMAPRRGSVVRPLLGLRRSDCEDICVALGVAPLRDPMNHDRSFRRVVVREDLLPRLSEAAGRDLVPVLTRQAEVLRTESDYLDELARAAWPPAPDTTPAATLARLPLPLARRAVRTWVGLPPPSFADVERVLAVARGEARAAELTGGRRVERRAGALALHRASVAP
jgi:tRNA(Ile)-lysidine synthase